MAPKRGKKRGAKAGKARPAAPAEDPKRQAKPRPRDERPAPSDEVEAPAPSESFPVEASDRHIPMVVGIGASAGGLEAFSQVLSSLSPEAKVAIVFVQHLSPQHESALPVLLASRTPLPVIQVTEGLRIEPQHVYVIPPNVQMGITDGTLHLLPRTTDRFQFTPIDFFFQSLSRWAQNRAVGIILSGTASDGAAGIKEIKAAGGITIAQDPSSAKYDGMPRAAIATGMVDLVLSPAAIAEHLAQIETHPYLESVAPPGQQPDVTPSEDQLAEIFALLRRVSGVDFRQYKMPTVKRRLLRRMALHRLTDPRTYVQFLRENPKEVGFLYQDLLIHVTRFFREAESFSVLSGTVFPALVEERSEDEPLRIWVPGCATGEEAYSVGIVLMEALGDQAASRRVQIFATDVSEVAIEQARAGFYPASIAADVSPERLRRFFTKVDGGYKINKALRDACVFARHDLTRDPPFSRLDLIVCRNVMIYLDVALQKRLVSVFHYSLKSNGFLMLGPAETTGHQSLFAVVDKRWRLYRKAPIDVVLPLSLSVERFSHLPAAVHAVRPAVKGEKRSVHDEATRVLLQRYGPSSVVVDENLQIVQFRGQTGDFLEPPAGEPNLNLLKMAREGLLFPLRSALQVARRKHRLVRKEGLLVRRNGNWHKINLEVVPLSASGSGHLLVAFEEGATATARRRASTDGGGPRGRIQTKRDADERVEGLTRELAANRDYLQSIIQELEAANEELQSANEEILSSNEELQSTNEELDTAKEELQSTNEELNTVNEELHSRNDELSHVNSDLINLLATVDSTILIVGDDMCIRRFTPTAERVLNLIPGDIGRPVGHINMNLVSEDVEALTKETIETMRSRELEVRDRQGRWYSLRIRPYKNVDNRIDGAVLTLTDIGSVKLLQQEIERGREHLLGAVALMREPVLVIDDEMSVTAANEAFTRFFSVDADALSSVPASVKLRTMLQQLQESDGGVKDLLFEPEFSQGGPMRVKVNARRFPLEGSKWTVLTFEDAKNVESPE
jgi:two-component system CheB/CheR fusion protein